MKLDDNIVDNNEEQYIPIRARGNTIVGYVPLRFLLSDDFDAKLICNYINMNDKEEIYSKLNKIHKRRFTSKRFMSSPRSDQKRYKA